MKTVLTGNRAQERLDLLLSPSEMTPGDSKYQRELYQDGSHGYYQDEKVIVAFDNRPGNDCYVEEFNSEVGARIWLGEYKKVKFEESLSDRIRAQCGPYSCLNCD